MKVIRFEQCFLKMSNPTFASSHWWNCLESGGNLYKDQILDAQGARNHYELLGVPIGEKCLPQLLGTSRNRLHKVMKGCLDNRFGNKAGLRTQPKTDSADAFFLSVYISQGQCLPDRFPDGRNYKNFATHCIPDELATNWL